MNVAIIPPHHQVTLHSPIIKPVPVQVAAAAAAAVAVVVVIVVVAVTAAAAAAAPLTDNPPITTTLARVIVPTHTMFILGLMAMVTLKVKMDVVMDMVQVVMVVQEVRCPLLVVHQDVCHPIVTQHEEQPDLPATINSDSQCSTCPCTN